MKALRFTKGMAAASRRRPSLAGLGERATVAPRGRRRLIPSKSWLTRQGLRVEMRRWRKGLAGPFVIRWHMALGAE